MKVRLNVLLMLLLILAISLPVHAQNLLANPSFEVGPYGNFPYEGVYTPTGWTPSSDAYLTSYTGVFDSTWKNHNCNYPTWPDPVHQPVEGNYFLAKWLAPEDGTQTACEFENNAKKPSYGHLRQTITGLSAGSPYYFSAWFANNNPHGWWTDRGWQYPMFRVGVLRQTYDPGTGTLTPEFKADDPTDTLGVIFVPLQEDNPEEWSNYLKKMAGSDEAWSKLSGKIALEPGQNAITYFIEFFTDVSVGYSEAQYVQVDNCRLAQTNLLEISNVQVTAINSNSVTIEWDVKDGDAVVTGLTGAQCYLQYGATTSYGSTQGATEPNPTLCNGATAGQPGHYRAVLNNLTTGQPYHYRIVVLPGSYTRVEPYTCGDGSIINSDSWSYDGSQSPDATVTPNPKIIIDNVLATNVTANSATISWTTDVASDSRVDFGKFNKFEDVKTDSTLTTNHSVTLTGLWPNTNSYVYKVTSTATDRAPATSSNFTFKTAIGPNIMNGDFEFGAVTAAKAPYWTDVPKFGGPMLFHSPEWGVNAQQGDWYLSMVTNFGGAQEKKGVYQQIATNAGDIVSVYAWSFADGTADCITGTPAGELHRFGEVNNQIGLDPKGATPTSFVSYPTTITWGAQLGSTNFHLYKNDPCSRTGEWRQLGICAVAESNLATVYLRARSWYANGWLYNVWDNVRLEPPTPVQSVGALKALPMQTNVNLTQGDYVVTYVQAYPADPDENNTQPYFYIQDCAKGGAGIKVTIGPRATWPDWIDVGKKVNIVGTIDWGIFRNYRYGNLDQQTRLDKPAGEMVLRAVRITDTGLTASLPDPVGVTNLSLGGGSSADPYFTNAGVAGGSGANNVGMRVRTWGKIVEIGQTLEGMVYLIVDDGSKLPMAPAGPIELPNGTMTMTSKINQFQHQPGLYVPTWDSMWPTHDDGTPVAEGDYVILTGVSGVRLDLDTDDINCVVAGSDPVQLIPEAEKNMRAIKLDWIGGAKYIKGQL